MNCTERRRPCSNRTSPREKTLRLENGVDRLRLRETREDTVSAPCTARSAALRHPDAAVRPRRRARGSATARKRAADAPRDWRRRRTLHRLPWQFPSALRTCAAFWAARRAAEAELREPEGRHSASFSRRTAAAAGRGTRWARQRRARAPAGPTRPTSPCGSPGAGRVRVREGRGRARARGTRCARRAAEEEEEKGELALLGGGEGARETDVAREEAGAAVCVGENPGQLDSLWAHSLREREQGRTEGAPPPVNVELLDDADHVSRAEAQVVGLRAWLSCQSGHLRRVRERERGRTCPP